MDCSRLERAAIMRRVFSQGQARDFYVTQVLFYLPRKLCIYMAKPTRLLEVRGGH